MKHLYRAVQQCDPVRSELITIFNSLELESNALNLYTKKGLEEICEENEYNNSMRIYYNLRSKYIIVCAPFYML